ncbi:hypothetical protein MJT46_012913 [Ovis ammon polii x Ovis aries]|nr:hypothetical protein MJT46_012913 [Ovis ammon polii x Ovis aries]
MISVVTVYRQVRGPPSSETTGTKNCNYLFTFGCNERQLRFRDQLWSKPLSLLCGKQLLLLMAPPGLQLDLTQKPELHVPGTLAAGGPATLACSFRGAYKETKALFVSWKGPNVSACTDGSSNSSSPYPSSLVLHFTLKPKDRSATLRCHLNFYLAHLPGSSMVRLQVAYKNSVSNALVKGLIQGVVYGSIATALFFFFLVLLAMKMLKWWEESHIPKASEALIPEKPEMLEEPKIPQESAAEPSPASVAAEVPFQQLSPSVPQMVMTLDGASPAPDPWRRQAHPLAATTLPGKDSKI